MTNEVESLILEKQENIRNVNFSERNAYLLYKNIWNFILETKKYEPNNIVISINFHIYNGVVSISKAEDVKYKLRRPRITSTWIGYYENSDLYKIKNLLKTVIDLDTFIRLVRNDEFLLKKELVDNGLLIDMMISEEKINNIINNVLESNCKVKILKKED